MTNQIKTTAKGTQYLDHICVFNGDKCHVIDDKAGEQIIDGQFGDKLSLVNALQAHNVILDPKHRISVEDGEMTQYHYFA